LKFTNIIKDSTETENSFGKNENRAPSTKRTFVKRLMGQDNQKAGTETKTILGFKKEKAHEDNESKCSADHQFYIELYSADLQIQRQFQTSPDNGSAALLGP
jgi:hypothetical protein